MGGSAFNHDLFPPPLPPPLIKHYHSLEKGIGIFSRRYGITHAPHHVRECQNITWTRMWLAYTISTTGI